MGRGPDRLIDVVLDEETLARRSPEVEHERAVAIYDLLDGNEFRLIGRDGGPYVLHLRLEDRRLIFDVRDQQGRPLHRIGLSLTPFRSLIRDYFTICDSYYAAIKTQSPSRIEAIDLGRKALHDDGAALLRERLASHVAVDETTARRLFTLVCVLHTRG